ncbi:hypothetical protein PPTG_20884 [Phytophthora nicotianae INRA-310]|uniref:Uncharacterized protein n=1 Tax=Phytophthora nicotianae (strain INRA-310) TaxID=761204 RepID=W2R9M0_PHYN3|nr:hypothetical protein PPTG_20884 [Phytophthora nicotianae INRA-310]ETN22087.1 hypothetical protein PPTG_20884 [Phytophthora nicotianae INRA-310]
MTKIDEKAQTLDKIVRWRQRHFGPVIKIEEQRLIVGTRKCVSAKDATFTRKMSVITWQSFQTSLN